MSTAVGHTFGRLEEFVMSSMLPWRSATAGWLALLGLSSTSATSAAARRPEVAVIGVHVEGQDIAASELAGNTLSAALEDSAKIDVIGIENAFTDTEAVMSLTFALSAKQGAGSRLWVHCFFRHCGQPT